MPSRLPLRAPKRASFQGTNGVWGLRLILKVSGSFKVATRLWSFGLTVFRVEGVFPKALNPRLQVDLRLGVLLVGS